VHVGIAIDAALAARIFEERAAKQVSCALAEDLWPVTGSAVLVSLETESWR
jgi:hypothetical protein